MSSPIIDQRLYMVTEAANLLGMAYRPAQTWFDGHPERQNGEHSEQCSLLTWGEFLELGLIREYRKRDYGGILPMFRLLSEHLSQKLSISYPLLHAYLYDDTVGQESQETRKQIVYEAQQSLDCPAAFEIVAKDCNGLRLSLAASRFSKKAVLSLEDDRDDYPVRFYPVGATSLVCLDPHIACGVPTVQGVAVDKLWELHDAGKKLHEIASLHNINVASAREAISYQEHRRVTGFA